MNPLEIAKDAISIVSNAGLKKDVIDLFEKKVGLLAEENIALTTEVASLKRKVADLENELERLNPKQNRLEQDAEKILKFLFTLNRACLVGQIAAALRLSKQITEYHVWELKEAGMIDAAREGMDVICEILHKGNGYVIKNKLAD